MMSSALVEQKNSRLIIILSFVHMRIRHEDKYMSILIGILYVRIIPIRNHNNFVKCGRYLDMCTCVAK